MLLALAFVCTCVCVCVSCCPSQTMLKLSMYLCAIVYVCLLALSVMFARLMHSVWFRSESLLSPVSCLETPLAAAFVCLLMLCPSIKPCLAA